MFANREHILAIEPWGKGMLGTTLRYDYEVRDEKEFFKGIGSQRVPKEMVSLASHILDNKAGHFDPAKFKDEYELALRKLVKRKAAGKTIEPPEEKEDRSNVIDLMEALRQSVKGAGSGRPRCAPAATARRAASRVLVKSAVRARQPSAHLETAIGALAAFCTTVSYIPQLRKCWRPARLAISRSRCCCSWTVACRFGLCMA